MGTTTHIMTMLSILTILDHVGHVGHLGNVPKVVKMVNIRGGVSLAILKGAFIADFCARCITA